MEKKIILILFICMGIITSNYAQNISASATLGLAKPQGSSFIDANGEKMVGGGLGLDLDLIYHFDKYNYKLGAGIAYNTSLLFALSDELLDGRLYSIDLYGVKGTYQFFEGNFSPYVELTMGLSRLSTPDIYLGDSTLLVEETKAFNFGVMPEVGFKLGGFVVSGAYLPPFKFKNVDATAGVLQVSLGYRYNFY